MDYTSATRKDELLRAARLVANTGIHTKDWWRTRYQVFFGDAGLQRSGSRAQIERYMVWLGQALGYKIGALKIVELRHRAENALDHKFDIGKFHDIVLGEGTLPLSLQEAKVDRWIAESEQSRFGWAMPPFFRQ